MKKLKTGALKWIIKNSAGQIGKLILTIIFGVATSLLGVRLAMMSRDVIDVALGDIDGSLLRESIALLFVVVAQLIIMAASASVKVRLSGRLIITMRQSIFSGLMKKDWQTLSAHHSGELMNRINNDVNIVVTGVSNILPSIFSIISKLSGALAAMFMLDKTFAFVAVFVAPPVLLAAGVYSKKMKTLHKKVQQAEGKSSAFIQESLQNILMIKAFTGESFMAKRSRLLQDVAYKLKIKRNTVSILASAGLFLVFSGTYYVALAWGAYRLANGLITVGTITAFLQLVNQIQTPILNLSALLPQYYSMLASAERIMEIEKLPDEQRKNKAKLKTKDFEKIEFKNVSFSYVADEKVMENVSFVINKKDFVAITGESGAGKSTLVKLLLGIINPVSGEVTFSVAGKEFAADECTRKLFSYVPQGNMILSGTVRENIRFTNDTATDEEIEKCARLAEIWDFIAGAENGLDTMLGERGLGLSEGQVQRLAIARALLQDAPILLFDEATSALDGETEKRILENIRKMTDKTCIMITHKAAALDICNGNIHLESGKIKQR